MKDIFNFFEKPKDPRSFSAIRIMLASPEETAQAIWERLPGEKVWLEDKFDGIRAQVHRSAERVEIFTRDLKPISGQFPEVCASMRLLSDEVVFDGEIIAAITAGDADTAERIMSGHVSLRAEQARDLIARWKTRRAATARGR